MQFEPVFQGRGDLILKQPQVLRFLYILIYTESTDKEIN